jgi:hypothetical protein
MKTNRVVNVCGVALAFLLVSTGCGSRPRDPGFLTLFDGQLFSGWQLGPGAVDAFALADGALVTRRGAAGRMFTERQYGDFVLRFEVRAEEGGSLGLAMRAPTEGDPSVLGLEMQLGPGVRSTERGMLGDHGSLVGVARSTAAQGGYFRRVDGWNEQEIVVRGRQIRSTLNGREILDVDLNRLPNPEVLVVRPGLMRDRGHVGLVARGGGVELRNIRIRELPQAVLVNMAPEGFEALFDGRTLRNWQGLVDPPTRAKLSVGDRKVAQIRADYVMTRNWGVEDGALVYRGKGFDNLCTIREFGDMELWVDWKIAPGSDSGLYLRGNPQIQIWDHAMGSGGLYNNQRHPSQPLVRADRYPETWNRFRIVLVGERVSVWLNNELVVHNTVFENYWNRGQPIPPRGPIELQAHETPVWFRNIYVRALVRDGALQPEH